MSFIESTYNKIYKGVTWFKMRIFKEYAGVDLKVYK